MRQTPRGSRQPRPVPLRNRLREATQEWHERLEADLDLLQPDLTPARYRSILERFFGFYAPLEQKVEAALHPLMPDFVQARRKTPALTRDLLHLGSNPAALSRSTSLPGIESPFAALGCMYVTEGATLGGQILSRHIERTLSLSTEAGCSFFSGYGVATGSMWSGFLDVLGQYSSSAADEAAINAAVSTFTCLHEWLCEGRG